MAMVSYTTFKTMMAGKGHSEDALADAFSSFDEDNTGAVPARDLQHVISALPSPMSEKDRATEEAKRKMNLKMGQAIDYISSILGGMVAKEFEGTRGRAPHSCSTAHARADARRSART